MARELPLLVAPFYLMDDLDLGATIKGFSPGQKLFGRYTLKAQLGRGGMGVVWRARDESLERDVAIKMLPEVVANDPSAVRDLKRETAKSQQLSHPHILRIYDFVEAGPLCGITMELVEGGTLTAKRLEQPGEVFTVESLRDWVGQLCEALEYAHSREKIVHRDLKPANLMLTAAGQLKVADFGIAASVSDSVSRVSQQGGSSGTPVYMSPQQMMGEKPAVSDDIYALGATLYELLTGKPPFYSGNIIMQVQNKVPPSVTERRAELGVTGGPIPAEWEQTISACLAKDAAVRPQSAGEVAERLGLGTGGGTRRTVAEVPVESRPAKPAAPAPAASGKKSQSGLFAGIAAAVVVLGGLGWYFGGYLPEQKRLSEIARLEAEKNTEEANRLRTEHEKAAAEGRARQEQEAAAAKEIAEREQREYAIIAARIDAFVDGSPELLRANTDNAVKAYLAGAPDRYRTEIERRWIDRQSGWEVARLAAARGGIVVRTNPPGAEVRVGAIALDRSPLTLKDQKLGRYPVRIRLDGYEEWSGEVEVKENEFADLDVRLVRSTGRVVLTGTAGATVTVGDRTLGTLPLTLDNVPIGAVRYALTLKGHKPAELSGEVTRNAELRLSATLEKQLSPQPGLPWENSIGQKFVPVPGTQVLFCIWETRVRDFEAFVNATGHDATQNVNSIQDGRWGAFGHNWKNPGFSQGPMHPVCGVNWFDAQAFCAWLTQKERALGILRADQAYRLPLRSEWFAAVGPTTYPWGNEWPPTAQSGNYGGTETRGSGWPSDWPMGESHFDGYPRTSPVGSFAANPIGLFDMGGNVAEWSADSTSSGGNTKAMFGGCFYESDKDRERMKSRFESSNLASERNILLGFRLVLVTGLSP